MDLKAKNSSDFSVDKNQKIIENKKIAYELKKIVCLLIAIFMFLVLWTNRSKLYPENILLYLETNTKSFFRSSKFPKEVDGNIVAANNIKFMGNNLAILSDTSFTLLNKSAYKIREIKHNLNNPSFKSASVRAILYDIGGKKLRVESQPKALHTFETENNIISADISENGTYSILTESHSYLSELTVYSCKNLKKYKYYFSEIYASDVSLNSLGSKGAICGVYNENGYISSKIYILNFKSEKPENIYHLKNNLVTEVKYFSNGNVLAIGDKYLSVINPSTGASKNFSYDDKLFKFYSFDKDYGLCCCLSASFNKNQNDEIEVIDTSGRCINNIKTNQSLKAISHSRNRILTISADKLTAYSLDGQYEGYLNIKNIYRKLISNSGGCAYLLGNNSIDKIRICNLKRT